MLGGLVDVEEVGGVVHCRLSEQRWQHLAQHLRQDHPECCFQFIAAHARASSSTSPCTGADRMRIPTQSRALPVLPLFTFGTCAIRVLKSRCVSGSSPLSSAHFLNSL